MKELNLKIKYLQVFLLALVLILSSALPGRAWPIEDLEPVVEIPFFAPPNGFDWTVPNRFGNRNVDGLVNFNWVQDGPYDRNGHYNPAFVHPSEYPVIFDGCRTSLEAEENLSENTYHWRFLFPGEPENYDQRDIVGHACRVTRGFPQQGTYLARLTIRRPDNSVVLDEEGRGNPFMQEVVVKDYLIVSIGDSFASGEGNPDIPGSLWYFPFPVPGMWFVDNHPRWQYARCGRSIWGGPAQAALAIERSDPRTSVTFLSFACSGSTIDTPFWEGNDINKPIGVGILRPYRGSEMPPNGSYEEDTFIPSQIDQVRAAVQGRTIDALIISGGGNDIRFGTVAEKCVMTANCWSNAYASEVPGGSLYRLDTLVHRALVALPGKFDLLDAEIDTLDFANVFITEYPDLTRSDHINAENDLDRYCSLVGDILPGFDITPFEARQASQLALDQLNLRVEAAAGKHGWTYVGGIADQFRGSLDGKGHGYCASDAWIRNASDSFFMQGPFWMNDYIAPIIFPKVSTKGTLHPTARGHQVYAQRLREEILPRLNPVAPGTPPPSFNASLTSVPYTSRQGQNGWLTGRCSGEACSSDRAVLKVDATAQAAGSSLRATRVSINGVEGCSGVTGISCTSITSADLKTHSWYFTISKTGIYQLEFQARDSNLQISTFTYEAKVDLLDPYASATIPEDTPSHANWYTAPVPVLLGSSDLPGLSGVATIQYTLDGTAGEILPGSTLTVETDGSHSLLYYAVDFAGRQSPQQTLSFQIDQTPPATTVTAVSGGSYQPDSWTKDNVLLTLNTADNPNGSGVAALSYSAVGAQPINFTTVSGSTVELLLSAEGATTISFYAEDEAGNVESVQSFIVRIDKTEPVVSCDSADGAWHASDVSISCSANDGGSGFAGGSTAVFNLTTNVPAGTETADASTSSMQICDLAGNCVTAGPITGNKVDKKAPEITVSSPTSGNYLLNEVVASSYGCDDQGSGLVSCSGTVADGSQIDTASPGVKVFQVQAADQVGNVSIQEINYNVTYNLCLLYDPGKSYKKGSTVPIRLQICDTADVNFSDASITLNSVDLVKIDNSASSDVASSGNANPDNNFRYDGDLPGYIYNLGTKNLSTGTWALHFTATGDPVIHKVYFDVK
jgi:hypothetical protein